MSEIEKSAAQTVIATLKLNSLANTDAKSKSKIEKDAMNGVKSVKLEPKSGQNIKTENEKDQKTIESKLQEQTQEKDLVAKVEKIATKSDEKLPDVNRAIGKPQIKPKSKKKSKPSPSTNKDIQSKSNVKDNNLKSETQTNKKPVVKPEIKPDVTSETQTLTTTQTTPSVTTVKDAKNEETNIENLPKQSVQLKKKPKLKAKPLIQPETKADEKTEINVGEKPILDPETSNPKSEIDSESAVKQENKSIKKSKANDVLKTNPEVEPVVKPEVKAIELMVKATEIRMEQQAEPEKKQDNKLKLKPKAKVAVKPKPEVKSEPEIKSEPEVKPEPVVKSEVVTKDEFKTKPVDESEIKIKKPKPKVKPQIKPKMNSDLEAIDSEFKKEPSPTSPTESEVKQMEAKPVVDVEAHPEVKPEVEPKVKPKVKPDVEPEVKPKEKTESKTGIKPKVKPEVKQIEENKNQSEDKMQFKATQNDFKTEREPQKATKDKPKKKPRINPKTEIITETKVSESQITNQNSGSDIKPPSEQNKSDDLKKDQKPKKKGLFGGLFKSKKKNAKPDSNESGVQEKKLTSKERKKIEKEQQKAEKLEAKKLKKLEKEQKKSEKFDSKSTNQLKSGENAIRQNENSKSTTKEIESGDISASPKIPSKPPRTPSSIKRQKEREAKKKLDEKQKIENEQKVDSESKVQEHEGSKKDDFESKVKIEAKSEAKSEVNPESQPEVGPEVKSKLKPEVGTVETLEARTKVEKDEEIEDIPDFNEIPDDNSFGSSAETSKLKNNEEVTTESPVKAVEEIKPEVNEDAIPKSIVVVEKKPELDVKLETKTNLEVDELPDFNDVPEALKKTEPENSETAQLEFKLEVVTKEKEPESKAAATDDFDKHALAEDATEIVTVVDSNVVPNTVRKNSFSSEDSDDGSLFDFSDEDDIETAIKLNLSEKSPSTVATKISTSESLKQEILFELVEKKHTLEQTPEQTSDQPSDKNIDEDFPNFDEVPEEYSEGANVIAEFTSVSNDVVDDSKARNTEGSFILKNDENKSVLVEESNDYTKNEIPDFNESPETAAIPVETMESLPDADGDSFIGSDESVFDENIRFSDEDDSDDIPSRYSQDQVVTPRNSGDDKIELDEHRDSFNVGNQPEFRFSQGSTTEEGRFNPSCGSKCRFVDPLLKRWTKTTKNH